MIESPRRAIVKFLGGLVALFGAGSYGCGSMGSGASSASDEQHPLLGAAAPQFDLPSPDAKQKITLAAYAGKVVVVDFWATWCAPCHDSFPAYQRIAEKFGSKVAVVGISVDEDAAGIPKFAKETGAKFPLAWDDGQVTSKSYQPPTMPTSFIVDRSGIVRFVHSGFHSGEEQEIESEISSLLK
jgi:cytochrome c biogenesis protein CcmG, thiol:disulfide interchange protein DsbE